MPGLLADTTGFVFPNDAHPPWSIMIVLYPYITGLVAGAFVVSALYHVFGRSALKPVARLAIVVSLCFAACATLPLLLHLHQPLRCLNVVVTPSPTSAMAGFGFIYSAYMLVLVVETWLLFRPTIVERATTLPGWRGMAYRVLALGVCDISPRAAAIDRRLVHGLSVLGIPVACVLHGYVGFLFGAIKANPWWSSPLVPVVFLCSAIVSGIAALVLLYLVLCARRGIEPDETCTRSLCRSLWLFLILAVALEGLDVLHMAYEREAEWHLVKHLLTHQLAVSYGLFQVLLGAGIPLLLLPLAAFWHRLSLSAVRTLAVVSSACVLLQVLAMRWNVVVGGQVFSKSFRGFVDYPVTVLGREGLLAAGGVLLLPLVLLWVALKVLPCGPGEAAGHEDAAEPGAVIP